MCLVEKSKFSVYIYSWILSKKEASLYCYLQLGKVSMSQNHPANPSRSNKSVGPDLAEFEAGDTQWSSADVHPSAAFADEAQNLWHCNPLQFMGSLGIPRKGLLIL